MPRRRRSFELGAFYHLTTRGNGGGGIVVDDWDRRMFVALLARAASRFRLHVLAWCLMTNHYHLVVEARGDVSRALQLLNGGYARHFNERHGRSGHLFGGRFRATSLETDTDLAAACGYVILNPVRAGLVRRPADWPWAGSVVGSHA